MSTTTDAGIPVSSDEIWLTLEDRIRADAVYGCDEVGAARIFQLVIVPLLSAGLSFLATADWSQPLKVVRRLAVPSVALIVAFSTL